VVDLHDTTVLILDGTASAETKGWLTSRVSMNMNILD